MSAQIVLLMAGAGSRFARAGYSASKPLIEVDGEPMFGRALSSLGDLPADRLLAVVRQQQIEEEAIDQRLNEVCPDLELVVLPGMTRGAAESALAAASLLDPDRPVVVLDCDLEFRSSEYVSLARSAPDGDFDVLLLTFPADDARYSFAQVESAGVVTAVAEKQVISDRAIAGAYCFSTAERFVSSAQRVVDRGERAGVPEFYMSEVVLDVLDRGGRVRAAAVEHYASFGTPEELDEFLLVRRA